MQTESRETMPTSITDLAKQHFQGLGLKEADIDPTLRLIEDSMMENARIQGERLIESLRSMQSRHPSIGDVRGKGLMVGVELVLDKATKKPAPNLRDRVVDAAYYRGLLLLGCGLSTIRLVPALSVPPHIVDEALEVFDETLTAMEQEAGL